MEHKIHYGWVICALCVMTMFCTMGLTSNTFSIYINAFIEENGFSKAQGASLSTVRCVASLLGTMITGFYYKRLNLRKGLSLAVVMIALSFFIYSQAHSLAVFYAGAFIAGLGYGLGTMVPVTMVINRWFQSRQGFALGFASAGSGLATIVSPPLITSGLEAGGVHLAALTEGGLVLAYGVVMFLLLRNSPEEKGLAPYQKPGESLSHDGEAETRMEAQKKPLSRSGDIILIGALFLLGIVTTPSSESLAVHLSTESVTPELTATAVSIYGLFMTGGKFVYGALSDRIGSYRTNYIFTTILASGLFAGFFAGNDNMVATFLFVALMGFGFSMTTVGLSVWALAFYQGERATSAVRHFWISTLIGSLTFTSVPGVFADMMGSYRAYYAMSGIILLIVMTIIQTMYRKYPLASNVAASDTPDRGE